MEKLNEKESYNLLGGGVDFRSARFSLVRALPQIRWMLNLRLITIRKRL